MVRCNRRLEFDLLNSMVRSEAKAAGDLMEALVPCSIVRYAVIQASSKMDGYERLVIAYQDENCLRDLIAASSIDGLGFASRQEALTNIEGHMSDVVPSKQRSRTTPTFHEAHKKGDLPSGQGLVAQRTKFQAILRSALATLIAVFYSKGVVSAMIRVAFGASF